MAGKTRGSATVDTEPTVEVHQGDRISAQPTVEPARPQRSAPSGGEPCGTCGAELAIVRMTVDGSDLIMESCDTCDVRRWQLAGERIDLPQVLSEFGEHAGRRR